MFTCTEYSSQMFPKKFTISQFNTLTKKQRFWNTLIQILCYYLSFIQFNKYAIFLQVLVDASDQCNQLNFLLGANAIGIATIPNRSWNLKVRFHPLSSI
jgi:uncharacterized membrane protein